jgi:hypothetical protein
MHEDISRFGDESKNSTHKKKSGKFEYNRDLERETCFAFCFYKFGITVFIFHE